MASLTCALCWAGSAVALQPLEAFVGAAQNDSVDAVEARALAAQRSDEANQARARLAPALSARGAYTRNEPFVPPIVVATGQLDAMGKPILQKVTIVEQNQLDASLSASMPLIDVGAWLRISGTSASAEAAKIRADATGLELRKGVSRLYYQVVATDAAIGAAQRALTASEQNAKVVGDRFAAGTASELDVARARAEAERSRQALVAAQGAYALAKNSLQTATGLKPADGNMPSLEDALAREAPLETLAPGIARLPTIRASQLETKAAERNAQAAWAALAPTISASATEKFTNATGFTGQNSSFQFVVQALWNVDASTYFGAKAQDAVHAQVAARERRAMLAAKDDLFNAWQQVETQIATARAAKAQVEATQKAARLVRDRYQVGSATQLDVTQADRDALSAEIALIQAYADLAYARALVVANSGRASAKVGGP